MAQYPTSFVNLAGFTQGIQKGIDNVVKINELKEERARQEIDDFQKNYDAKKIRTRDIPDFVSSFENYKKSALLYSRLNRSGAKPIEMAAAEEAKRRAMVDMSTIYTNSSTAKDLINERADYRIQLTNKGYTVPTEVNDEVDELTITPASQLNFEKYKSPFKIDLKPNKNDYKLAEAQFKNTPEDIDFAEIGTEKVDVPGVGAFEIKKVKKIKGADINSVLNSASTAFKASPKLFNEYKSTADNLKNGLSIPPNTLNPQLEQTRQLAIQAFEKLRNSAGEWLTPENISPEVLLANDYNKFKKRTLAIEYDDSQFKNALKIKGIKEKSNAYNLALARFEETKRAAKEREGLAVERFAETKVMNKARLRKMNSALDAMKAVIQTKKQ